RDDKVPQACIRLARAEVYGVAAAQRNEADHIGARYASRGSDLAGRGVRKWSGRGTSRSPGDESQGDDRGPQPSPPLNPVHHFLLKRMGLFHNNPFTSRCLRLDSSCDVLTWTASLRAISPARTRSCREVDERHERQGSHPRPDSLTGLFDQTRYRRMTRPRMKGGNGLKGCLTSLPAHRNSTMRSVFASQGCE